jgi:hypothetical protein
VRATCLCVATRVRSPVAEVVVIGELVATRLIGQRAMPAGASAHVGATDLNVGLKLRLLGKGRYRTLTARLLDAGFTQDQTEEKGRRGKEGAAGPAR